MKKDETAEAIARLREEGKAPPADKEKAPRLASEELKSQMGHAEKGGSHRKPGGGVPSVTTRRPKTIGS